MGILHRIITNPNYRGISEDEMADYAEQAREEQYEREQQKRWSRNAGKHVLDPDREGVEEE